MPKATQKDWLAARQPAPAPSQGIAKARQRLPLKVTVDTATLAGLPLFRWSMSPGDVLMPESFALDPDLNLDFTPRKRQPLPLALTVTRPEEARMDIAFDLPEELRCLGLGERYSGLNLRGKVHTLLTTDDYRHHEGTNMLYKSIPVLYLFGPKGTFLIFLDSPAPTRWDLDSRLTETGRIELHSRRAARLYVAGPAKLPELVRLYTTLTGRTPLPPRWSLGHQQSRWSYPTEARVREIATEFRAREIPCDTVVLDIDYMQDYRVFTISRERFPKFETMVADLKRFGFRVVTIVDPGVKYSKRDPVFVEGVKRDIFCKLANGKPFVGKVWAGESCLPDFLLARTRDFWGEQIRTLLDRGVAGIWNDMNEPALFGQQRPFDPATCPLPKDRDQLFLQTSPEGKVGHFEVRGLYGMQMARAAFEAQLVHSPDARPFTLTRSTHAGGQRYGAVWLGDNLSWFEHLRHSIPMLLNMGLSGFPFAGVDIGGFGEHGDAELLVRWYELGIFYPFFRNHCSMGQAAQEPWAFGPKVERAIQRLIATRYSLTHYLERLFVEHRETGAPLMRPMAFHYPEDKIARTLDDQFLFGEDLLVAPILRRGKTDRVIYFPKGTFESFDRSIVVEGPCHRHWSWKFGEVPAFVRHGAVLPLVSAMQHMGEIERTTLTLRCYGPKAKGRLWLDDGVSTSDEAPHGDWGLAFRRGRFEATAHHEQPYTVGRKTFVEALGKRIAFELP